MNIEQYKSMIEKSFREYEIIQEQHLNIMQTNQLPDLKTMTQERDAAFFNLTEILNKFIENAGTIGGQDSLPILTQFEGRLSSILAVDEKISFEINKHRSRLQKSLEQLKQGKIAMQGYKMTGKNPNHPCVLSMNR